MLADAKRGETNAPIRIENVSGSNYHDLPGADFGLDCKSCLYWEMEWGQSIHTVPEPDAAKRQWFTASSALYGPCGKLAYDGDKVVGWAQYAPATCFPRAGGYHARPSSDAYLITCLAVAPQYRNQGVGTTLLSSIVEDLRERGVTAVETFAKKSDSNNPSGPVGLYLTQGFKVKADDPELPLLRLDILPLPSRILQARSSPDFSNVHVSRNFPRGTQVIH